MIECGIVEPDEIIRVQKGWGFESWHVNREYCGKTLHFFSGRRCSVHYHINKHETFLVTSGKFNIRYAQQPIVLPNYRSGLSWRDIEFKWIASTWERSWESVELFPGDAFVVPRLCAHQIIAVGGDSVLTEFSTHHEDSDSYRIIKGD